MKPDNTPEKCKKITFKSRINTKGMQIIFMVLG